MPGLLDGIKVLDLSRVLAGPWAGQVLADLGAEVIKVERPGVGDDTRGWGPPFLSDPQGETLPHDSAYFLCTNRGKKSVTIDITQPAGQDMVKALAKQSDILLENFKVGGLARFGLGFDDLEKLNPRLIYCSISGFGQTGPYRDRPGYDFLMQAMGGLMSVTGDADGEPTKVGVAVTDLFAGMYAATAVLAALNERERSHKGQHIDIALFDVQVATLANQIMSYLVSGKQPTRLGNAHPSIVPYQAFHTADDNMVVAVGNDAQFQRFAQAIGVPALDVDVRFLRNEGRVVNRQALISIIEPVMRSRETATWVNVLGAVGVPCGPINSFGDLETNENVVARGLFKTISHQHAGDIRGVASPMRFSRSNVDDEVAPPSLGADTEAVLRDKLGASDADIALWRESNLI